MTLKSGLWARLKRIIASQALDLEVKTELKNAYRACEKIAVMKDFKDRVSLTSLCRWVSLSKSVYYYKPTLGKQGRKPSVHTLHCGEPVTNAAVVEEIRGILSEPFVCYGYENTTVELKRKNYHINKKNVYRLMNENRLLLGKVMRINGRHQFVQHRKINSTKPM